MRLPNLLNAALQLTGKQNFLLFKFASRATQVNGQDLSSFFPPIPVCGNVQAVPRELFQEYGLDFEKNALAFYISREILDIQRDVSGDQIEYNGKRYNCITQTPWNAQNGWTGVIAAEFQALTVRNAC